MKLSKLSHWWGCVLLGLVFNRCGLAQPENEATNRPRETRSPNSSELLRREFQHFEESIEQLRKIDPSRARTAEHELQRAVRALRLKVSAPAQPAKLQLSKPRESRFTPKNPRFETASKLIAQLNQLGKKRLASQFEQRLAAMRSAIESGSNYPFGVKDDPEVHQVRLERGAVLPEEYRSDNSPLSMGYAEVHVQDVASPIILILDAVDPVLWKVVADPRTRIQAIVVKSLDKNKVVGLENPWILDAWAKVKRQRMQNPIYVAGDIPITHFYERIYSGKPIVLGSKNTEWMASYLVREVEDLISQCRSEIQISQAGFLKDLRFVGNRLTWLEGNAMRMTTGEFTVAGPIVTSHKPAKNFGKTLTVMQGGEELGFSLTPWGRFQFLSKGTSPGGEVARPADLLPGYPKFAAMAFDQKRRRILLAATTGAKTQTDVVALDLEGYQWSRIATLERYPIGMTYDKTSDAIWVVLSLYSMDDGSERAEFVQLGPTGDIIARTPISHPLGDSGHTQSEHFRSSWQKPWESQLMEVDGRAVLLGHRELRDPAIKRPPTSEVFVIDPASGRLVFAGRLTPNDGTDPVEILKNRLPPRSPLEEYSVIAEVSGKLAKAKGLIAELSAQDEAKQLMDELTGIEMMVLGEDEPKRDDKRLYLVGRGQSKEPMTVHVTDTSGPVVLALCGRQAIEWNVQLDEGVNLERVICSGLMPQVVRVTSYKAIAEHIKGNEAFLVTAEGDQNGLQKAERRLAELTGGLPITALSLESQATNRTLVVGLENGKFRSQIVLHELDRLTAEAHRRQHARALRELRFAALYRGAVPGTRRHPEARIEEFDCWSEFSIRGPLIGTSVEIRKGHRACLVPDTNELFLSTPLELKKRDLYAPPDNPNEMPDFLKRMKAGLRPRPGQLTIGLTYDRNQNRLVIDRGPKVEVFDLASGKTAELMQKNHAQQAASTYSTATQLVYVLSWYDNQSKINRIQRFDEQGHELSPIELSIPFDRHPVPGRPLGDLVQIIDLPPYLVILSFPPATMAQATEPRGRIAVVEISTGDVVYEGSLQPQFEFRDIADNQLAALWEKLGTSEPNATEASIWGMAVAGDKAVAYLREKYEPSAATLDASDLAFMIRNLGDSDFAVRDKAYNTLVLAGRSNEPAVVEYLKGELSAEVRNRLEGILKRWAVAETPDDLRMVHGLQVLARINTATSRELLESIQQADQTTLIKNAVKQALSNQ